jgi:hypothetical protein
MRYGMGIMPTLRIANLSPFRFEGWARGILLAFGDGTVAPVGLPIGSRIVAPGTPFGDGQARVVPFAVLWPRLVTDPQQFANFMAVQSLGISVRGCTNSHAGGNPRFSWDFSARQWATQHFTRAALALHTWENPVLGPARNTGQTGGQEDQAFAGCESLLAGGAGAETVNYLAALHFAGHPCHHLEADGSMVDAITRPNLRMFYSRPHRSGSDMLGKPRDQSLPETNGWNGPDAQHLFFSRLAMAARFKGTPACQRLLEHQARNYLIQLTTTPGAPTSKVWSAREVGWEGLAVVHLWRELRDRALAERVRSHWLERANWLSSQLPVTGPWDVLVDVGSLGTGSWWMPWQQALGAYGLDLACRVLGDGGTHLPLIAANAAKLVVDQAWTGDGARWVEWELLALDGRRQRSGTSTSCGRLCGQTARPTGATSTRGSSDGRPTLPRPTHGADRLRVRRLRPRDHRAARPPPSERRRALALHPVSAARVRVGAGRRRRGPMRRRGMQGVPVNKEPIPRRDPNHCSAGHDLSICGTYVENDGRVRCKKCLSERVNRCQKRKRLMRREVWVNRPNDASAGDG